MSFAGKYRVLYLFVNQSLNAYKIFVTKTGFKNIKWIYTTRYYCRKYHYWIDSEVWGVSHTTLLELTAWLSTTPPWHSLLVYPLYTIQSWLTVLRVAYIRVIYVFEQLFISHRVFILKKKKKNISSIANDERFSHLWCSFERFLFYIYI